MEIVELIINDNDEVSGVDAISLVEFPAIEENFVALKEHKIEFKAIDDDKRIVVGLALIPNKPIYRRNAEKEYYIYFSKDTVRKVAEKFIIEHKSNNATLEHSLQTNGVSVVESWIVENPEKDKTSIYNINASEGSWAVVMRIFNDEVWSEVKKGTYKGLSIEGYFADKLEAEKKNEADELLSKIKDVIVQLESYSDYPQSATNNAKRALEWAEKNGWGSCGEATGKQRANQLANREPISRDTIARMASFKRHQQNKDVPYSEGCGGLMWDAWGGTSGIEWAINKLDEIG